MHFCILYAGNYGHKKYAAVIIGETYCSCRFLTGGQYFKWFSVGATCI